MVGAFPATGILKNRNYALYLVGQTTSNVGTWVQRVAQVWLVLKLAPQPATGLALVTVLQYLPVALLSLPSGLVVDRYSRRTILCVAQIVLAAQAGMLGLLTLSGRETLGQVYMLAALQGAVTAFENPARQVFLSDLVTESQLRQAVSLNSALYDAARVVGPVIAAVLIQTAGGGWAFLANAGSFGAVLLSLLIMNNVRESRIEARNGKHEIFSGLSYIRQNTDMSLGLMLVGTVGIFSYNLQVTTPLLVTDVYHKSAAAYGVTLTALAAGAIVGGLVLTFGRSASLRNTAISAVVFGLIEAINAFMPDFPSFFVITILLGFVSVNFTARGKTFILGTCNPAMRGRVMSVYALIFMGGTALGAPLTAWLAQSAGVRSAQSIGGAIAVIAGLSIACAVKTSLERV